MGSSDIGTDIVGIVIDLLDGKTTPSVAACGMPAPVMSVFRLAHKLGQLDRGETIELNAAECGLLYEIIDASNSLLLAGKEPWSVDEQVAEMLTRVAFDNGDPFGWALNLLMTNESNTIWRVTRFARRHDEQSGGRHAQ